MIFTRRRANGYGTDREEKEGKKSKVERVDDFLDRDMEVDTVQ